MYYLAYLMRCLMRRRTWAQGLCLQTSVLQLLQPSYHSKLPCVRSHVLSACTTPQHGLPSNEDRSTAISRLDPGSLTQTACQMLHDFSSSSPAFLMSLTFIVWPIEPCNAIFWMMVVSASP